MIPPRVQTLLLCSMSANNGTQANARLLLYKAFGKRKMQRIVTSARCSIDSLGYRIYNEHRFLCGCDVTVAHCQVSLFLSSPLPVITLDQFLFWAKRQISLQRMHKSGPH